MSTADSVVVIGAGQGGVQAAISLRELGFDGKLYVLGEEPVPPYQRPPLSKEYLAGASHADGLPLRPRAFYEHRGIDLRLGDPVVGVDRDSSRVKTRSGESFSWDRLIFAVGGVPYMPAIADAAGPGTHMLRTWADADALSARLARTQHLVVVGGGFVGLEAAAVVRARGRDVSIIEADSRLMSRAVSAPTAAALHRRHLEAGVRIRLGDAVTAVHRSPSGLVESVRTLRGLRIPADTVLIAAGIRPLTSLAESCGLAVDNGIRVDRTLRTTDHRIFAIGDCASFPMGRDGRRVRLESIQNAVAQARHVARQIVAGSEPFAAVPWFWTRQYELKLQMAGTADGCDEMVVESSTGGSSHAVSGYAGGELRYVESINDATRHAAARRELVANGWYTTV